MNTTPTTEDRIWSIFAHLSALSFGMGILLPVVGWSDQRRKSNYASFQSLQALGYQSVGFTVWVLSYLVIIILASVVFLAILAPGPTSDAIFPPGMIVFFLILFAGFAVYFIFPIIAAIACALGRDFRYPFLGNRLARYLSYDSSSKQEQDRWLDEDREFRWVAAMGHFSILIMLWGMLAPLTAWILQGKNSLFLKFQAVQTIVYHIVTMVFYFVGGFSYLFGFIILFTVMGSIGISDQGSSTAIVSTVVLVVVFLIAAILILLVPLLHILGQWAGYRVLKGDDYRYPLIGKPIESWMRRQNLLADDGRPNLIEEKIA